MTWHSYWDYLSRVGSSTNVLYTVFVMLRTLTLTAFGALAVIANSQALAIGWAANGGASIQSAPNNTTLTMGSTTISAWESETVYSPFAFASVLGISVATLGSADVIAFEHNGGGAPLAHFESSRWDLNNGPFTQSIVQDETNAVLNPGVVATGSINQASYNAFFGISGSTSPVVSWMLINSALDVLDPGFNLSIRNGLTGEGTPDIDAVGRICACTVPEPSTLAVAGLGLVALWRRRRSR